MKTLLKSLWLAFFPKKEILVNKTVIEWLGTLPDPVRSHAVWNCFPEKKEFVCLNLFEALCTAFNWKLSSEGYRIWSQISFQIFLNKDLRGFVFPVTNTERILQFLAVGNASGREIADDLHISRATIFKALTRLRNQSLIYVQYKTKKGVNVYGINSSPHVLNKIFT